MVLGGRKGCLILFLNTVYLKYGWCCSKKDLELYIETLGKGQILRTDTGTGRYLILIIYITTFG